MNPELRGSAAHVYVDDLEAPVLGADDRHHLERALRLRDGEAVTASDGRGSWRSMRWSAGDVVSVGDVHHDRRVVSLTVAAAMPKGDRLEWMVEKLTELGVDRIVLLQCERGVVRWDSDRATKSMERLTRIVRAAASQSRRVWLPSLVGPLEAAGFLAAQPDAALCEPAGPGLAASEPLPGCLVVGPEGGFSPAELGACHHRVSLGPTILRVETAAVAAAAQWTALCPIDHGA